MFNTKNARLQKGMTQAELAEKIGVHQTAVSQWEVGTAQPSAKIIPEILKALGCNINDIFIGEEETLHA